MKEEHIETTGALREPLKEKVLRNLDLVAVGAALVLLGLHLAGVLLGVPAEAREAIRAMRQTGERIRRAMEARTFPLEHQKERVRAVEERLLRGWKPDLAAPGPVPEHATYPRVLVEAARNGESNEIRFLPPVGVRVEARRGANVLHWGEHEDNNTKLSGFVILRGAGPVGSGPLTELVTLPGDQDTYEDTGVKPGLTYSYRVVALTEELANQGVTRSDPSRPVTVETLADFKISLEDADPTSRTARFLVEKWHREEWWPKRFQCKVGEVVGGPDAGTGVDYTTPRRLTGLEVKPTRVTRTLREVVFDEAARVLVRDGLPVTEEVPVTEEFLLVSARLEGGELPPKTLTLEKR